MELLNMFIKVNWELLTDNKMLEYYIYFQG